MRNLKGLSRPTGPDDANKALQMATLYPPACTAASTALGFFLDALGGTQVDPVPLPALPDGIRVTERDAVLVATTPGTESLYRAAAERLAAGERLDVALLRIDELRNEAVHVTVDLTLAALPHEPWPMRDLSLWVGSGRELWLVPAAFGPAVAVTDEGFLLDLLPPYDSMATRLIGISMAARAIGRILAPAGAR